MRRAARFTAIAVALALLGGACSSDSDSDDKPEVAEGKETAIPDDLPLQGVTDTSVKIGIAWLALGEGKMKDYWDAVLAEYREQGKLPVNGRDIEPVYYELKLDNFAETNRGACLSLAQEGKVFLVTGALHLQALGECVTLEQKLIYMGAAGPAPNSETMARTAPLLFHNNMSQSRSIRNWAHWADEEGYLKGKKIGVIALDDPKNQAEIDRTLKPELKKLGYTVTADGVWTDASSTPGIVQRFKAAGVEVVFQSSSGALDSLSQELGAQSYFPHLLYSDFDNSAVSASVVRDLPDGIKADALTSYQRATDGSQGNPPPPAARTECLDIIAKHTGKKLVEFADGRPTADYGLVHASQHVCDLMAALVAALKKAGPDLTPASMVRALEKTKVDSGELLEIAFGPGKHDGVNQFKAVRWEPSCDCWKHQMDARAPWVD